MQLDEKLYAACFPFWPELSLAEQELLGQHSRQQSYLAGENVQHSPPDDICRITRFMGGGGKSGEVLRAQDSRTSNAAGS